MNEYSCLRGICIKLFSKKKKYVITWTEANPLNGTTHSPAIVVAGVIHSIRCRLDNRSHYFTILLRTIFWCRNFSSLRIYMDGVLCLSTRFTIFQAISKMDSLMVLVCSGLTARNEN